MHPPLNRPHPDCQEEIEALRNCHATKRFFQLTACNEVKFAMDKCFGREKKRLLAELNKDMHEKRKREEEAFASAVGHEMSFEEYLQQDKEYQDAVKKSSKQQGRNDGQYQKNSLGGWHK